MIRALLLALLMTSQLAYGMCSKELILNSSKQIGHEITLEDMENRESEAGNTENGIFYACKALPNNKNLVVVTFAAINESLTKSYPLYSDGGAIYDLISMVIDARNKSQIAKHLSKGALESNAVRLQSLTIDTGRYYLESGSIAFGVRSGAAANSHSYVADYTNLFLYKLSNNSLTVILNGLEVGSTSGSIEDKCDVKSVFKNSKKILSVSPQLTNGMHDLEVIEKNDHETTAGCSDEPNTITPAKGRKITLKYDGQEYPIPKGW